LTLRFQFKYTLFHTKTAEKFLCFQLLLSATVFIVVLASPGSQRIAQVMFYIMFKRFI